MSYQATNSRASERRSDREPPSPHEPPGRAGAMAARGTGSDEAAPAIGLPDVTMADLHRAGDLARSEIARADAKAGLLAAIAIPIAGILLAVPSLTPLHGITLAFAWAAALFMFIGIGYLGSVVWPQLRGNVGINFVSSTPPDQLAKVIMERSIDPVGRRTFAAAESNLLARLATAKYRRVRRAILCLGSGTTLLFVTCISLTISNLQ